MWARLPWVTQDAGWSRSASAYLKLGSAAPTQYLSLTMWYSPSLLSTTPAFCEYQVFNEVFGSILKYFKCFCGLFTCFCSMKSEYEVLKVL